MDTVRYHYSFQQISKNQHFKLFKVSPWFCSSIPYFVFRSQQHTKSVLHHIAGFRCGWHCLHGSSLTVFPSLLTVCIYFYMAFWPLYWHPNNCQNACKCLDVCLTHGDKVAFGICCKCPLQFEWTCKVHWGQRMLLVNSGWTKVDWVSTWVVTHFL